MFSHIAEETTRLSHGFLGALFGILLVEAQADFMQMALLCCALYVAFLLNTANLHLYFLQRRSAQSRLLSLLGLVIAETLLLGGIFIVFFLDVGFKPQLAHPITVRFGLIVYGAFMLFMNLSHLAEIMVIDQADTRGGQAA